MVDAAAHRYELQLLGQVRLLLSGRPQLLKTRKALALLMLLALEGSASRQRLCAWLWPDLDESSARRNLRRELVRLRDAGVADAVRSEGDFLYPGAALTCDLFEAEVHLAAGRPDAALAMWHGAAAQALSWSDDEGGLAAWLQALRQRVHGLRTQALEASAAAAEARGDLNGALARVTALLADDGLQERHHRSAMRLLAAAGQREAALRQFDTCRNLLASELGLSPMPETLALAQRLREGAPPADAPDAPDAPDTANSATAGTPMAPTVRTVHMVQLPALLPFVGREAEVARLQRTWSRRQVVVLVGEAGVGKTRLAADFAAAQGPYALLRCHQGERELPLAAFARALRLLAGTPPDLSGLEPWVAGELARLLPELGAVPPPLNSANERLRFDEACVRAWLVLAGDAFDTIVLDDWQWADDASRALLARVSARRLEQGGAGAVELLAWRGEVGDPALHTAVESLSAEVVALGPLPDAAVQALVSQLAGVAAPVRFAERLRRATGGHPYFIAETLRDLAERELLHCDATGRWHTPFDEHTEDYRELPLPASVRDAVLARVQRLGAPAARLLEAAALAGEPLRLAWLASACALSELEALAALEDAERAQLVSARDGGGYGWAHDLARLALESSLAPTRRRLVHHRLALAAAGKAAHLDAARHFEACGEPTRAAPHRLAAGDAAHALQALAEAAAHWRQGLADQPAAADAVALRARLCDTAWALGQVDEARDHHARLLATLAGPDAVVLTTAQCADAQLRAARYLTHSGRPQEAIVLLDAMSPADTTALRLQAWTERMGALHQCGRLDEALADGLKALEAAPDGSRERANVLASLSTVEHLRGQMNAAVGHADASLGIFTRLGDALGRARGLFYRGAFRAEMGDNATAATDLRESATLAARHGNVYLQRLALYNLASVFSNQTRPDEALAVAREAWPTLAATPGEELAVMFRALFIECHYLRGEWGLAWEHLVPAVDQVLAHRQPLTLLGVANCVLEPAAALGQWPQVLPLVQALEDRLFDDVPVAAEIWLGCAQAALMMGDPEAAARWLQRVSTAGEKEHARVGCRARLLRADLALCNGAGALALADVPADDAPGMNAELRLRALGLRCRAGADAATRERALAALDDPSAHAGAALCVARSLGGGVYVALRQRLADGLAAWPSLQHSVAETWR